MSGKGGGNAIGRGHQRIGVMACLLCAREIPVKKTGGGKLSACCSWCDLPLYVNPRTEAYDLVMCRVKLDADEAGAGAASSSSASASSEASPPAADPAKEEKAPPERSFLSPLFGGT